MVRSVSSAALLLLVLACGDEAGDATSAAASTGDSTHGGGPASDPTLASSTGVTGQDDGPASSDGGTDSSSAGSSGAGDTGADTSSSGGELVPCPGALCDDFESGALDPAVWTYQEISRGNAIDVQSDDVAHGDFAVRFHAAAETSFAMAFIEELPAELHAHYFGRAYVRITGFPFENGGHTGYVTAANTLDGFPYADHHHEIGSYFADEGPIWQLTYWTGDGPEYIGAGGQIPQDAWFCLEWEFDDDPDRIVVWVDGSEDQGWAFEDIQGMSGLLGGQMRTLGLGFRTFHPMGAPDLDVYADDLVLDTERVGCLP